MKEKNKIAVYCYMLMTLILSAFFWVTYLTDNNSIVLSIVVTVLGLIPAGGAFFWYRFRDDESQIMPYYVMGSFMLLYAIIMYGFDSSMTFTLAIPIMVAIMVYGDAKLSKTTSTFVIGINLIYFYLKYTGGDITFNRESNLATAMQILCIVAVSFFTYMISKMLMELNQKKYNEVFESKVKADDMLDTATKVSKCIVEITGKVDTDVKTLIDSLTQTIYSMKEVCDGTNSSAESVQTQMVKTEEITRQIEVVDRISQTISKDLEEVLYTVNEGSTLIKEMVEQVEITESINGKVSHKLKNLVESTEQMTDIIQVIDNIADETNLLALNASIEGARAGEAGKGFAVVASQITKLANQTQESTVSIGELIEKISHEIKDVVEYVNTLIDSNEVQNKSISDTALKYKKINENASDVSKLAEEFVTAVGTLNVANKEIATSIESISAITEQVTSHATVTYDSSEVNAKTIRKVANLVLGLNTEADKLDRLSTR